MDYLQFFMPQLVTFITALIFLIFLLNFLLKNESIESSRKIKIKVFAIFFIISLLYFIPATIKYSAYNKIKKTTIDTTSTEEARRNFEKKVGENSKIDSLNKTK